MKNILNKIIITFILAILLTDALCCNRLEQEIVSQTTNATTVIITTTSLTLTTTITSTIFVVTPNTTETLIRASEIINANGNIGVYPSNPARIGVKVSGAMAILPYNPYFEPLEPTGEFYTDKITMLEIMRGKNALDYLTDFGLFDGFPYYKSLPESGYEYLLVTIQFEYYQRDLPGNITYKMEQGDFKTFSQENIEYNTPFILPWKTNAFNYDITPGDVVTIKIATVVRANDQKPLMLFKKGEKWFGLY